MTRNHQLVCDAEKGDCMRACVTSILGIPNDPSLPNCDDPEWYLKWFKFLRQFGFELRYAQTACWRNGYWIASVPSLNFPDGTHAIVMDGTKVAFDPSPKKRYRRGMSLTGTGKVLGGHYFEITDPDLLPAFVAYKFSRSL